MGRHKTIISKHETTQIHDLLNQTRSKLISLSEEELKKWALKLFDSNFKLIADKKSYNFALKMIKKNFRHPLKNIFYNSQEDLKTIYQREYRFLDEYVSKTKSIPTFIKMLTLKNFHENLTLSNWNTGTVRALTDKNENDKYKTLVQWIGEEQVANAMFPEEKYNIEVKLPVKFTDHLYGNNFYCNFFLQSLLPYVNKNRLKKYIDYLEDGNSFRVKLLQQILVADYLVIFDHLKIANDLMDKHGNQSKSLPIYDKRLYSVLEAKYQLKESQIRNILRSFFEEDYQKISL